MNLGAQVGAQHELDNNSVFGCLFFRWSCVHLHEVREDEKKNCSTLQFAHHLMSNIWVDYKDFCKNSKRCMNINNSHSLMWVESTVSCAHTRTVNGNEEEKKKKKNEIVCCLVWRFFSIILWTEQFSKSERISLRNSFIRLSHVCGEISCFPAQPSMRRGKQISLGQFYGSIFICQQSR